MPRNNLETDHKENTPRVVYRAFPSGFTISTYYFIIPYILDDYTLHMKKLENRRTDFYEISY
jgi:hypothetical protein